ncbi:DUF2207 family protein [Salipaludibacillus sp. HK11]|uniref:DUF2207 family protein n=1 Tax=Salipaludibacillus sp. HK11 TaxID=3394320 RepID=UPI0039FD169C
MNAFQSFNLMLIATFETGFLLLFIFLVVVVFAVMALERLKRRSMVGEKKRLTESDFQTFSPPLIAQFLYGRGVYTRHITAGLLNLVRKRIITLNEDKRGPTYYFSIEGAEFQATSRDDQYLLDWLLYDVGQDGVFYVDDLLIYTKDKAQRERFIHRLDEWEQTMKEELKQKGLLATFPIYKRVLLVVSILMILIGSAWIVASALLSILYLVGGVTTFVLMLSGSSMTHAGRVEQERWKPFIDGLTRLPEKNIEEGKKLTANLVYAIAFGVKDDYIKQFPIREASQVSLRDQQFPLYFAMTPGVTAISFEGKHMIDDLEASLEQVVSPVGHSDDAIQEEFSDFSE